MKTDPAAARSGAAPQQEGRILELASYWARQRHNDGEKNTSKLYNTHDWHFDTCNHPDCELVRTYPAALAAARDELIQALRADLASDPDGDRSNHTRYALGLVTDNPAVVAIMGAEPECAENGCQLVVERKAVAVARAEERPHVLATRTSDALSAPPHDALARERLLDLPAVPDDLRGNWHNITGPNGQCACGPEQACSAQLLAALAAARLALQQWRCFHCDEVFTDRTEALEHFGEYLDDTPACLIKGEDGGLLKRVRELEAEVLDAYNQRNAYENDARLWHEAEAERKRLQGRYEPGRDTSWFMFLDALDGERIVLSNRADAAEAAQTALRQLVEEEIRAHDAGPNAEYCWWCNADINGQNGPVMPHEPTCWRIRAEAAGARDLADRLAREDSERGHNHGHSQKGTSS